MKVRISSISFYFIIHVQFRHIFVLMYNFDFLCAIMCNPVQVCASTIINYMIVALLSISITTFVAMMLHDYSENCMQEKGSALVIPYVGPFQRLASKCLVTRLDLETIARSKISFLDIFIRKIDQNSQFWLFWPQKVIKI